MSSPTRYRSPLAGARGHGAARSGAGHWIAQRVTALALIPLTLWFVASVIALIGADHASFSAWMANPLVAVPMVLFLLAGFYHAMLGVQVVIEDYIQSEGWKTALVIGMKFIFVFLGGLGVFSVLKIAFGG
ncbi:MAG: succinate dehydrogenase, hydrophobic membrane anchor protein [Alphaproteobacteria bacterium]